MKETNLDTKTENQTVPNSEITDHANVNENEWKMNLQILINL